MSDQLLLDRIKELEGENSRLKTKSIRWQTISNNVGHWFRKHGEDIGAGVILILFFGSIAAIAMWLASGWATDKFYLEFGNSSQNGGACIYQEYDWGKDAIVECDYNISDKPNYVNRIEIIRNEWLKAKDIGREK